MRIIKRKQVEDIEQMPKAKTREKIPKAATIIKKINRKKQFVRAEDEVEEEEEEEETLSKWSVGGLKGGNKHVGMTRDQYFMRKTT